MSRPVVLTWMTDFKEEMIEECLLVSESDACYYLDDQDEVAEHKGLMDLLMKTGLVIFEDGEGIFCLPPEQIIKIELKIDLKPI